MRSRGGFDKQHNACRLRLHRLAKPLTLPPLILAWRLTIVSLAVKASGLRHGCLPFPCRNGRPVDNCIARVGAGRFVKKYWRRHQGDVHQASRCRGTNGGNTLHTPHQWPAGSFHSGNRTMLLGLNPLFFSVSTLPITFMAFMSIIVIEPSLIPGRLSNAFCT